MTLYSVTLDLPSSLYERVKQQAQLAKRTVEAELLEVLEAAVPDANQQATNLNETLSALALLDDELLLNTVHNHLPHDMVVRLEQLNHKQQREGLTKSEAEELEHLAQQYEKAILVRSEALLLLQQRNYSYT